MMNSIAPFWDGNETWLVLGGGGCGSPSRMPTPSSPALYLPVIVMLLALVFRGVSFEFLSGRQYQKRYWNFALQPARRLPPSARG